jgi:hypothetical protein
MTSRVIMMIGCTVKIDETVDETVDETKSIETETESSLFVTTQHGAPRVRAVPYPPALSPSSDSDSERTSLQTRREACQRRRKGVL